MLWLLAGILSGDGTAKVDLMNMDIPQDNQVDVLRLCSLFEQRRDLVCQLLRIHVPTGCAFQE